MRNTVTAISTLLISIFRMASKPLTPLPPPQVSMGSNLRSGLDSQLIVSKIIKRQAEAGAFSGPLDDGSRNVMESMYRIIVEEIVDALLTCLKVDVVIPPGGLTLMANGANAGGPVVSTGYNTNYSLATGIIR